MTDSGTGAAQHPRAVLGPIFQRINGELLDGGSVELGDIRRRIEAGFVQSGHRVPRPGRTRRRILVIRLDEIGDNVLNSAFLRGLRELCPDDEIDLFVKPASYPLMERCPYVDDVLHLRGPGSMLFGDLFRWMYQICDQVLWERYYDACIVPRWDVDETMSGMLAFFCGAKERVGFSVHVTPMKERLNPGIDLFLTRPIQTPPYVVHEVEKGMFLLRVLGAKQPEGRLEVWLGADDVAAAKAQIAKAGGRPVAVAVATREARKTYPPELLAKALSSLLDTDAVFFLLGGQEDAEAAAVIEQALPKGRAVNLAGKTPLRVSAAFVALSSLYMGGDTGLTHVAAATGRPIVEWFCHAQDTVASVNSLYARFYPWHVPAIVLRPDHAAGPCATKVTQFSEVAGCRSKDEAHCICGITPDAIARAARRFLG